MSNEWVHRCLIIPTAYTPLARALCDELAPVTSGSGMFAVPMSSTGSPTPLYFIASGLIKEEFASLLPFTSYAVNETGDVIALGQPEVIVQLSQGAATLLQVNALLTAIDVSDQEPFVAMQRLGLKLIQEEL